MPNITLTLQGGLTEGAFAVNQAKIDKVLADMENGVDFIKFINGQDGYTYLTKWYQTTHISCVTIS